MEKGVYVPSDISQEFTMVNTSLVPHGLFLESFFNLCEVALEFG